jgi:integrase
MLKEPKYAHLCQRILTISGLRVQRTHIPYLDRSQLNAVLNVVKRETWVGERNFTLMLFAAQTGLRNSELLSLRRSSIAADWGTVRCVCKGQEDRVTPIPKQASRQLQSWMNRIATDPSALLFPDKNGRQLSADSFQFLTRKYKLLAQVDCPSLRNIRVTPHVFRHTCAMMLIEAGVDIYSVSRWLGHKSIDTTARYLECNLAMKRKALTAFTSQNVSPSRTPLFKGKTLDFLQRTCSPVAILDAQGNRLGKN